jgi:hypothetical protein
MHQTRLQTWNLVFGRSRYRKFRFQCSNDTNFPLKVNVKQGRREEVKAGGGYF